MATAFETRVPMWFWIGSGLALICASIGCFAYVTQVSMTPEQIAALPDGQRQLFEMMPAWVSAVYAIAVWSTLVGAVALLMRRSWARPLFIAALIAVLVQFGWSFLVAKAAELVGPSAYPLPVTVIVLAIVLIWFSGQALKKGVLR